MTKKILSGIALCLVSTFTLAQQPFSTPEKATDALAQAINDQNEAAMAHLLGENWRTFLPPEGVDPGAVDRFVRDWKDQHKTVVDGDVAHLVVGDDNWQLPIPVIKTAAGWQFDMQEAAEEILTREIGRDEPCVCAKNCQYGREEGRALLASSARSGTQPARACIQPKRAGCGLSRVSVPHPAG
jgi:hypothetical protein